MFIISVSINRADATSTPNKEDEHPSWLLGRTSHMHMSYHALTASVAASCGLEADRGGRAHRSDYGVLSTGVVGVHDASLRNTSDLTEVHNHG